MFHGDIRYAVQYGPAISCGYGDPKGGLVVQAVCSGANGYGIGRCVVISRAYRYGAAVN